MSKPIELVLGEIKVKRRHRKDAGNIDGLAASIAEIGLLQPIGVWPDHTLACGWRRLLAVKQLGWEKVPVHVLRGRDDLLTRLKAERDENTCRKEFLPEEAALMGMAIEAVEKPKAEERKQEGRRKGATETNKKLGRKASGESLAENFSASDSGDARDKVGEALGMSGVSYEKAKAVVKAAEAEPEKHSDLVQMMNETGKVDRAYRKLKGRQEKEKEAAAVVAVPSVLTGERCRLEKRDCIAFLSSQPAGSIDLVFGSPPYEQARLYLENGKDEGIARDTDAWVAWMVEVYRAALHACKGLVAFVVEGQTKDYCWSAAPALLMADLRRGGIHLRKPPAYHRVGIPGSGGPDWLRNDYEFVVCATNGGELPWSDNTAMGQSPRYEPGGSFSYRNADGSRVNQEDGYASMEDRGNIGAHRARQRAGRKYEPPERANPGNVIRCTAGGGNMGDKICHENEAPFPEALAEFFVRSFCPLGGVVCDPFCGSGTTGKVALSCSRRFLGCDIRASQVQLTRRRLAEIQTELFEEVAT